MPLICLHFIGKFSHLLQSRPHLSKHRLSDLRTRFVRSSGVEGRMLDRIRCKLFSLSAEILPEEDGEQGESKVDAGCHSTSCDAVAVRHNSLIHRCRAEGEHIRGKPNGRLH